MKDYFFLFSLIIIIIIFIFFVKKPSSFNLVSFIIIKTKRETIYLTLNDFS